VVVRLDAQLPPTVHHRQQAQLVILRRPLRHLAQAELVQHLVLQQQIAVQPLLLLEHGPARRRDPAREAGAIAAQHELEQLGHARGVLADLRAGLGVQDGEAGVDVPLVAVDAQRHVDLDVLDPARVPRHLPRELPVVRPRGAHAQEGGVRHRLRVRRDLVVPRRRQVHVLRLEAGEHGLDLRQRRLAGPVPDEDERLLAGVDGGAMERVDGDDGDVGGEMPLEGFDFWRLARGLAANYSTMLGSCISKPSVRAAAASLQSCEWNPRTSCIHAHHLVDRLCFYAVYDEVTVSRNEVPVFHDVNVLLYISQLSEGRYVHDVCTGLLPCRHIRPSIARTCPVGHTH